ncbi:unnamed protein product [Rotaria sp. Silwood2]|nr:unnamed protein product [Rotaria sp. Silwood2]CAF3376154.1 unnamed protein product [Rotaria sp. Silwood2]
MGGGALSAVASAAGFGLKQHEYNQFQNRMSWITNVGTIEELTDVARQVARKLADRYEDQLLSLRPRSDEVSQVCLCCCAPSAPSTKDDSSAKKTPTKAMGPAEQVASFGVAAALQIIVDGTCTKLELAKYKEPEYLADTLTEVICSVRPNFKTKVLQHLKLDKSAILPYTPIEKIKQGEKLSQWYLHEFYYKPGIYIINGKEKVKQDPLSSMDPKVYYYRLGTFEEYKNLCDLDKVLTKAISNNCCC